jgi:catechol 2,3-dioxygenase-like lactoylglutathione lyase family enzyme
MEPGDGWQGIAGTREATEDQDKVDNPQTTSPPLTDKGQEEKGHEQTLTPLVRQPRPRAPRNDRGVRHATETIHGGGREQNAPGAGTLTNRWHMKNATLGAPIPILHVRHVEDALAYYVDRLGFQVDFRYEKDPSTYAGVKRDHVRLHLQHRDAHHFENGHNGHLRFRIPVDDPDMLHNEFRAMGVLEENVEVQDTEWGTREFGFEDPDGNGLVFFKLN